MHFSKQFYQFLQLYKSSYNPKLFLHSYTGFCSEGSSIPHKECAFGLDSLLLSETMAANDLHPFEISNGNESSKAFRIQKELSILENAGMENLFFAVNEFSYHPFLKTKNSDKTGGLRRCKDCLKAFHFVYVDIDFKDYKVLKGTNPSESEIAAVMKELMPEIKEKLNELPPVTMAVSSGHGIHLYWKIETLPHNSQIGSGNSLIWYSVQDYLYQFFKDYGSDSKVAHDYCRIMRVPGSINKKEGMQAKKSEVLWFTKTEPIDLFRFISEYQVPMNSKAERTARIPRQKGVTIAKSTGKKKEKYNNFIPYDNGDWLPPCGKKASVILTGLLPTYSNQFIQTGYQKQNNIRRRNDLIKLIKYRDNFGGCSKREYSLFAYRSVLLQLTGDKELALQDTLALNEQLVHKLSIQEVMTNTKSAEMYYDNNSFYWTNSSFVKELEITPEEIKAAHLECFITDEMKQIRKITYDKERYNLSLESKGKLSKSEQIRQICITLLDQALDMTKTKTKQLLANLYNVSIRTIERYIQRIKANPIIYA